MSKLEITVGSDPEFVITRDGYPVSALDVTPATKEKPTDLGNGVLCYADNALLEARINPSGTDRIVLGIGDMIRRLHSHVRSIDSSLSLIPKAAAIYSEEAMKHPENWVTGCNANYDAYRNAPNRPAKFSNSTRTGSFHIHIGNKNYKAAGSNDPLISHQSKLDAIKLLDLYVGIPSLIFDKDDSALLRRGLYGKAGEFRPTEYGVEYRVLGPYCTNSPRLIRLVFNLVEHAMSVLAAGEASTVLAKFNQASIVEAINLCNKKTAERMLTEIDLPHYLKSEITLNMPTEQQRGHDNWMT